MDRFLVQFNEYQITTRHINGAVFSVIKVSIVFSFVTFCERACVSMPI